MADIVCCPSTEEHVFKCNCGNCRLFLIGFCRCPLSLSHTSHTHVRREHFCNRHESLNTFFFCLQPDCSLFINSPSHLRPASWLNVMHIAQKLNGKFQWDSQSAHFSKRERINMSRMLNSTAIPSARSQVENDENISIWNFEKKKEEERMFDTCKNEALIDWKMLTIHIVSLCFSLHSPTRLLYALEWIDIGHLVIISQLGGGLDDDNFNMHPASSTNETRITEAKFMQIYSDKENHWIHWDGSEVLKLLFGKKKLSTMNLCDCELECNAILFPIIATKKNRISVGIFMWCCEFWFPMMIYGTDTTAFGAVWWHGSFVA